jgi:hypothetical protein
MSNLKNKINEIAISDNIGTNINQNKYQANPIENEEREEQDLSKSLTNNEVNTNTNSKKRQILISKRKMLCKKRIFKIIKKRRHNSFSNDNNANIIIKHFVNFFLNFINLAINEALRKNDININKEIKFKINSVIKHYISIDFITSKTVEDLIIQKTKQIYISKIRHEKKYIIDIEKSIKKNEKQIKKLKDIENANFQLDKLFKTKIICIFKELYAKNKKQNIDLSLYGIKGIKLNLDNNFQTFENIRNKYKDNKKKLEIFDYLIKHKFIFSPINFKVKKNK